MSDSFAYTPGAGGELGAADRIGGLLFQRVKMTFGPDGTALDVSAADPLPVALSTAQAADLAVLADATAIEDDPSPGNERGIVMLAVRRDSDTSTAADGDYTVLKMDEAGRLKVAAQPALSPLSTGAITANAQTVAVNVSRQSNIMVHMVAASLVGHNATFEGSIDSTNGTDGAWFAIQAVRSNANTIETATGVLAATPAYGWELSVNGLSWFRVRATAHTSGTATWKVQPAPYATEPIPAAQISGTQPVNLTTSSNLVGDMALQVRGNAIGAGTPVVINCPATPIAQSIKASSGRISLLKIRNVSAATRFVKFFNLATAVTMGTTPASWEYPIPAGGEMSIESPVGLGFTNGIQVAITAGAGLTNAAVVTAGDCIGFAVFA
jgi:hypothetical protein